MQRVFHTCWCLALSRLRAFRRRREMGAFVRTAVVVVCVVAPVVISGGGCTKVEKVTVKRSLLAGLPGAEGGVGEVDRGVARPVAEATTPVSELRTEDERGNITLHSRSARDVMVHVYSTMANEERELFVEQVLSEKTKAEFRERGLDPAIAFDELVRRQRDVLKLFGAVPYGEYTPGAQLQTVGRNVFRLEVSGGRARDLKWTFMDVVIESGEWRLRWFG